MFQLYNAFTLFSIWTVGKVDGSDSGSGKSEWQVGVCGLIFFILSSGNIITTVMVLQKKLGFANAKEAKAASAKKE